MSIRYDIEADQRWIAYEAKVLTITVTESDLTTPIDLDGHDLLWRVYRMQGGITILLEKTTGLGGGIDISGAADNEVVITIDPGDIAGGRWWHELWDLTNNLLLSDGDAYVHRASDPTSD